MTPLTSRPRVAVVVVTYQSEPVVGACLASLPGAALRTLLQPVVVVDNASSDGTVRAVREGWPDVTVVEAGGNLGYAAAINRALGAAVPDEVDAVLVLNPDTVLERGAVDQLVGALDARVGVVVPLMTSPDGTPSLSLRRWPSLATAASEALLGGRLAGRLGWGEVVADPVAYTRPHDVEWATGAAVLVGSRARRRLGGWDESFFLYSEETEYLLRAHDLGIAVRFEPSARCAHVGGASGTSATLWALLMTNKLRLYRRTHDPVASSAFRLCLLLGQLVRGLRGDAAARTAARWLAGRGPRDARAAVDAVRRAGPTA